MSQSCNTQACTSSSTSSSSSLTSVCTSGYKEGNTTEIEYYFNNCNPNEKEKNIRVIYKAA
ncbi:MAG: hypothetical protein LBQ24_04740 [Candidatus Peribacteria bacterium]|jgi:hypothetical protein|nr:hypothetical protein [Candidatus Peribacteria bacterium]